MVAQAKEIVREFGSAMSARSQWDSLWQEVADALGYSQRKFTSINTNGAEEGYRAYDAKAMESANRFADGVHGLLNNPSIKWFTLDPVMPFDRENSETRAWLDTARDAMLDFLNDSASGFNTQIRETYLDLGVFGTSAVSLTERGSDPTIQTWPLEELFLVSDDGRRPSRVFRRYQLTNREAVKRFGDKNVSEAVKTAMRSGKDTGDDGPSAKRTYVHAVKPRDKRNPSGRSATDKPWASFHVDLEAAHVVLESGFDSNPFYTPRFSRRPGEIYGRSPGTDLIRTIRLANTTSRDLHMIIQKTAAPPLLVNTQAKDGTINTSANSLIFVRGNIPNPISPLNVGNNPQIGLQYLQELLHTRIHNGFMLDILDPIPLNDRMTATEINERVRQKMQNASAVLSRIIEELLRPLLLDLLSMLVSRKHIVQPPDQLLDEHNGVNVQFLGPLALSQRSSDISNITSYMAFLEPLVRINPSILNRINADEVAKVGAFLHNVPQRILNDDEAVARISAEQQQQQTAAASASIAKDAASALKDTSQAVGTGVGGGF